MIHSMSSNLWYITITNMNQNIEMNGQLLLICILCMLETGLHAFINLISTPQN